jgi:hypothetical protein
VNRAAAWSIAATTWSSSSGRIGAWPSVGRRGARARGATSGPGATPPVLSPSESGRGRRESGRPVVPGTHTPLMADAARHTAVARRQSRPDLQDLPSVSTPGRHRCGGGSVSGTTSYHGVSAVCDGIAVGSPRAAAGDHRAR